MKILEMKNSIIVYKYTPTDTQVLELDSIENAISLFSNAYKGEFAFMGALVNAINGLYKKVDPYEFEIKVSPKGDFLRMRDGWDKMDKAGAIVSAEPKYIKKEFAYIDMGTGNFNELYARALIIKKSVEYWFGEVNIVIINNSCFILQNRKSIGFNDIEYDTLCRKYSVSVKKTCKQGAQKASQLQNAILSRSRI